MHFTSLIYEKKKEIALVRLNRPKVLNALDRDTWQELGKAVRAAELDDGVRALVLTGEGRAFSSGADLTAAKGRSPEAYREYLDHVQAASRRLILFGKPSIAAINGYALGSGFELALGCDIRIASEDAVVGFPEAKVASMVTGGTLRLLQELVGIGRAKALLFSSRNLSAQEASTAGLVEMITSAAELLPTAYRMAETFSKNAPLSIRMMKRGLRMAAGEASLSALMDFEVEACLACVGSAAREKSLAEFEGRKDKPQEGE